MGKKILIVSSEFPPMPGGIGNHAYCLAKELRSLDFEVTVLTEQREQNEGDWRAFVNNNKEIKLIGVRRSFPLVFTYLRRIIFAYKLIYRSRYDAVIFSGRFSVWLNVILPSTRSLAVVHGGELKQKSVARALFYRGLKRAKFIVCVSRFTKDQLISHYKDLDAGKVVVINNGINNDWLLNKMTKKDPNLRQLILVTVGGIHKRKGQLNVIGALPSIIKCFPNTEYHVVGLPVEKDNLLDLIHEKSVNDHVFFYHGLSNGQVKDLLNNSHIFLMLSEYLKNGDFEGFGIAAMEAMALGVPAIGTRNSGVADAISDGYSGRLVDAKNTEEIIAAIREIVADYGSYSKNAETWATGFQWKYRVKEYQALIETI